VAIRLPHEAGKPIFPPGSRVDVPGIIMRQLKRLKMLSQRHASPYQRRKAVAIAVAVAAAGLGAYLLPGSRDAAPYAGSSAEIGAQAVPASGRTCNNPTIIPMDPKNAQSGVAEGNYFVTNDTWNTGRYRGLSQRLYVCGYNSWYAIATMNNATGDGAVKASPNVQRTWYPAPTRLSRWKFITSQFSDVPPGEGSNYGIWEFEYDIWLNGLADSNSTEVMIWTYNNGQTPSGSPSGSFTDDGHTYDVYHSAPPYQYVAFVDRGNHLWGRVNLHDFFSYVISRGWVPRSSTLYQICNGVELVSTNSRAERFTINNFSINLKAN
jgi:Glycosyl hydrolase family 12